MTPKKTGVLLEAFAKGKPLVPQYAWCRMGQEEHIATAYKHSYAPSKNGVSDLPEWGDLPFIRDQRRVILRNCGSIDPLEIDEAIARGAYRGAATALLDKTPEEVIASFESGL